MSTELVLRDRYSGGRICLRVREGFVVGALGCEPERYLGLTEEAARHKARHSQRGAAALFVTVHVAGCRPAVREVPSLARASAVCREAIDADALGASDMGRAHGEVRDAAGALFARVAFNGRVFAPNGTLLLETRE